MNRELAWRVFASEYNDSNVEIKGQGEMAPSYVISPLGAKINRIFLVGVLTDVENITEGGNMIRAHISDPTGVFTLYSGQFQQEATDALSSIEVPSFVAVIGKSKTYKPEDSDDVFVSIRPERIEEVDLDTRNQWIIETCKSTKERIEAITEGKKMDEVNAYDLNKLGYSRVISDGVVTAIKNYDIIDAEKYINVIKEALNYLTPGAEDLSHMKLESKINEESPKKTIEIKDDNYKQERDDSKFEETEDDVLKVIRELEGDDGAPWDKITSKCEKLGLDKDAIEEALSSLMDKGLIYEPILGTIKTT